mmetsp:Transcript_38450/g.105926  ORF Transcript_38450/g.105926 Transcript_38450/m.105926 type:complete len:216 (-) Transcript_38450:701-1348(-)
MQARRSCEPGGSCSASAGKSSPSSGHWQSGARVLQPSSLPCCPPPRSGKGRGLPRAPATMIPRTICLRRAAMGLTVATSLCARRSNGSTGAWCGRRSGARSSITFTSRCRLPPTPRRFSTNLRSPLGPGRRSLPHLTRISWSLFLNRKACVRGPRSLCRRWRRRRHPRPSQPLRPLATAAGGPRLCPLRALPSGGPLSSSHASPSCRRHALCSKR